MYSFLLIAELILSESSCDRPEFVYRLMFYIVRNTELIFVSDFSDPRLY